MSNAPTRSVHSAIATGPLLLLLFLLFGCLAPGAAFAVDGYDQLGFRTISDDCGPFLIGKYEAQDASIAYCMNQERPGPTKPGGPWLNFDQGWVWLDDEFAAIVCHGYPTATSFGGYHLSPDRARAATQLAVWMLNGTTHVDGTYSYTTAQGKTKSGHFTTDNEVVAAARWLHDSAKSGSIKAAPHRARRYLGAVSGGSKRQDMLYVLPAVSVSFQKQSANAAITSGNNTYQFAGATFDVFESASDARVGTIQMDSNGRAQATLLPNTAYYLVETKAPAGFLLDRTPHIVDLAYADQKTPVVEARLNVSDDYTKVDISKVDASGEQEVEGAQLTLYGPDKTEIDSWTSSDKPHRVEHLAPGTYSLREMMSPRTYDLAKEITFEIKDTREVQSVAMKDAPIEIKGQVDKRQELVQPIGKGLLANGDGKNRAATQTNTDGLFSYTIDARNDSATWVDEFTITDDLECAKDGTARFISIETPVAIGDLNGLCNVWYRTTPLDSTDVDEPANATLDDGHENPWLESDEVKESLGEDCRLVDYDGWRLWKADVSTTESTTLEAEELDLASNTVVTGIRIEYGAVAADFTTRSDADSWTRDDLKDEHDDLDDAKAILGTDARGAVVHMQATSAYTPQTALTNSARVDLCRNGGGDKLESHDEDSVIQRCTLPQDLPATGSVPIAACITALLTSGTAALWFARLRSIPKKR